MRQLHNQRGHKLALTWLQVLGALLVSSVSCPLSAETTSGESFTEEIIELSGLEQYMQRMPKSYLSILDQVFIGIENHDRRLPKDLKLAVRQGFIEALKPHVLDQEVRHRLDRSLREETALPALQWLRSELGRKITAVETDAGSPESSLQLTAYVLQLQLEAPSPERLQLARRLNEASQVSESAMESWETVAVVAATAVDTIVPPAQQLGKEALRKKIATLRPNMKALLQQATLFQILFTYRTLTDAELTRYADFLESDVGREITRIVNGALKEAALTAIERMESDLTEVLTKRSQKIRT